MDLTTQDICTVAAKELCRCLESAFPEYKPAKFYVESDVDGFSRVNIYMRYLESVGLFVRKDAQVVLWAADWDKQVSSDELILAEVPLADPKCFDKIVKYYLKASADLDAFVAEMLPISFTE